MPDTLPDTMLQQWQKTLGGFLLHTAPETDSLQGWLKPANRNSAALKIYRNNVLYSLTEALADQFPTVKQLVGESFFKALARDFVFSHPPVEASLTFYGEQMPAFILGHEHCRPLPYLSDVARLDFMCQKSLHAADLQILDPFCLSTMDSDALLQMPLPLLPCVQFLESAWPVDQIRAANRSGSEAEIRINNDAVSVLLIRRLHDSVDVQPLTIQMFRFLQALQQGDILIDAWTKVQDQFGLPDQELTTLLVQSIGLQIIAQPGISL